MCGIFGIIIADPAQYSHQEIEHMVRQMFLLSESRGRESSGLALSLGGEISVLRQPLSASQLLKEESFARVMSRLQEKGVNNSSHLVIIGHARLVTNGDMERNENNQPVIKEGVITVHNGIIVNDAELWKMHPSLRRQFDVDTEILPALLHMYLEQGLSLSEATQEVFSQIEGTASVAMLMEDRPAVVLATNNGSLYYAKAHNDHAVCFASESVILQKFIQKTNFFGRHEEVRIAQLPPRYCGIINMDSPEVFLSDMSKRGGTPVNVLPTDKLQVITEHALRGVVAPSNTQTAKAESAAPQSVREYEMNKIAISRLHRCATCILPETMPFIAFDADGVCNYCTSYEPIKRKYQEELENFFSKEKKQNEALRVMVMFSGGRDSSYGLHVIKNELHLDPVAYTYDWGMITDLGRRNQARMCGALGVEQILVSADIKMKRENIKKNVMAWLNAPELGTVPLFMAGDKEYFAHANRLRDEMHIPLIMLLSNPYEKTSFKYGFCGIRPEKHTYKISMLSKLKLLVYYAQQFIKNPAYLNSTLLDSINAFVSYYLLSHKYLELFDYLPWNETEIDNVLRGYNWELASDAQTTWRIGDGTAPFYNYIYYTVAGFTENDTFRSNQIREGVITRREALRLAERDNAPRLESMKWYFETIGVDMEVALKRINEMPKLYGDQINLPK